MRRLGWQPGLVLPFLLLSNLVPCSFGSSSFTAPTEYPTGAYFNFAGGASFIWDFNGDGKPDLVNAVHTITFQNEIVVLPGNGDGTFQSPVITLLTGGAGGAISAVGDFNRDGKLDVLVGNSSTNPQTLWLGDGTGKFTAGTSIALGASSTSVAAADFNRDGKLDLVAGTTSGIVFFPGNGDGTFGAPVATSLPVSSNSTPFLQVADLNGDGKLDVLADYSGSTQVMPSIISYFTNIVPFLGLGDGRFLQATAITGPSEGASSGLVTADFNGDGIPDIAHLSVVSTVSGTTTFSTGFDLQVSFGRGDGTFTPPETYRSTLPQNGEGALETPWLAVAETDDDNGSCPELIVGVNGFFYLYPNLGSGNTGLTQFGPPVQFLAGNAYAASVADINGDGAPDLVTAQYGSFGVFLHTGDNMFTHVSALSDAGALATSGAFADFNGDGMLDVLSASGSLVTGVNPSGFAPPTYIGITGRIVVSGDFNQDGKQDAVFVASPGSAFPTTLSVMLGNGDGTFRAGPVYTVNSQIAALAVADLNNDGHLDLIAGTSPVGGINSTPVLVLVFAGAGNGTFTQTATISLPGPLDGLAGANNIAVADFNKDGYPDIALVQGSSVAILLGTGGGAFGPPSLVTMPSTIFLGPGVVAADLNGDQKLDLLISTQNTYNILLAGNGDGTFAAGTTLNLLQSTQAYAFADANGDRIPDLIACGREGDAAVMLGQSGGTFEAPQRYILGTEGLNNGPTGAGGCSQIFGGAVGAGTEGIVAFWTDILGETMVSEALAGRPLPQIAGRRRPQR